MIPHQILTALARERHSTLMAEAKAGRRARQARSHRQRASAFAGRKSPLRWVQEWLRPGRPPAGHFPG